jgi:protein disulfide-isomerase A6
VVKVGGVNADVEKSLGGRFGVRGFPTVKIFGLNKNKPEEFNGQRSAQSVIDSALLAIKNKVYANIGVKSSSSGKKVTPFLILII